MPEIRRHHRHHHYCVENNILFEGYRKSRGDLSFDFLAEVTFPDKDVLNQDDLEVIKAQLENKMIK